MATGNIDPTLAGHLTRAAAATDQFGNSVWNTEIVPGQDDHPSQDCRRGTLVRNYQFDNDGGTLGNINLGDALPDDIAIVGGWIEVTTAMTSDGAMTESLGVTGSDAGILADGNTLEATGLDIAAACLAAPVVVTNATTYVVLDVNTAAATAGAFTVYLDVIKLNG